MLCLPADSMATFFGLLVRTGLMEHCLKELQTGRSCGRACPVSCHMNRLLRTKHVLVCMPCTALAAIGDAGSFWPLPVLTTPTPSSWASSLLNALEPGLPCEMALAHS